MILQDNFLTIRLAKRDDLAQIRFLNRENKDLLWDESAFQNLLDNPNGIFWVLSLHSNPDKIVGELRGFTILDEAEITSITVDPEVRRQKIGFKLILTLQQYCQKNHIDKIFLEVRESNFPAIQLYETLGFCHLSFRREYYQDNLEGAYILQWKRSI